MIRLSKQVNIKSKLPRINIMEHLESVDFNPEIREEIWRNLIRIIENYITTVHQHPVTPKLEPEKIRSLLHSLDFESSLDPLKAMDLVSKGLWEHQVHTPHPNYFGLFNPTTTVMGIVADSIVATFNPQLAVWSHSPFAVEVEQYMVKMIGMKFGYSEDEVDGTFTTGGSEANFTAVLTSLTNKFPNYIAAGLRGLKKQPVLYASSESHHSIVRAARMSGLGDNAVRVIPADENYQMDTVMLQNQIEKDKKDGYLPLLIVATAGTTNAGIVDPISKIADIAVKEKIWFHVDAAWGGAAVFVPELQELLQGIERSDSITFDAHKWFSVPMGAGIFLTRHTKILEKTFALQTDYMPKDGEGLQVINPYTHSIQWSRRFIGLKVFLSLLVAGWKGYADVIHHQYEMGRLLRQELEKSGWEIINKTKLPVVCFTSNFNQKLVNAVETLAQTILDSGEAWISTTKMNSIPVLRACITNYRTSEGDIKKLVKLLNSKRLELMN